MTAWKPHWFICEFPKQRSGGNGIMGDLRQERNKASSNLALTGSCISRKPAPRPHSPDRWSHSQAEVSAGLWHWLLSLSPVIAAPLSQNSTPTIHTLVLALLARISTLPFLYTFSIHFNNVQPRWDVHLSDPGNPLGYWLLLLLVATEVQRFLRDLPPPYFSLMRHYF